MQIPIKTIRKGGVRKGKRGRGKKREGRKDKRKKKKEKEKEKREKIQTQILRVLATLRVELRIREVNVVISNSRGDLSFGSVPDEDGLSPPFDGDGVTLRDVLKVMR